MTTKRAVWGMAFVGLVLAITPILMMRKTLWPRLGAAEWAFIVLFLVLPLVLLWQHFRDASEATEQVNKAGYRIALAGYLPLWLTLSLMRRVLG